MSGREIAVDGLVALGVAVEVVAALGVLRMKDALDCLHFAGAATTAGPVLLATAVVVSGASRSGCIKVVLVALALLVTGPVLGHATARMTVLRRRELAKRRASNAEAGRGVPAADEEARR